LKADNGEWISAYECDAETAEVLGKEGHGAITDVLDMFRQK